MIENCVWGGGMGLFVVIYLQQPRLWPTESDLVYRRCFGADADGMHSKDESSASVGSSALPVVVNTKTYSIVPFKQKKRVQK